MTPKHCSGVIFYGRQSKKKSAGRNLRIFSVLIEYYNPLWYNKASILHIFLLGGELLSKLQYYSIRRIVELLLAQGGEGEFWDYKKEWHDNIEDLIKDIVCFANTVHDENCYIVFGVDDCCNIVGMEKSRRKQADIIDALSNLVFAGDISPKSLLIRLK